jgi:multicomponent Na+:H+ antiporter subunit G
MEYFGWGLVLLGCIFNVFSAFGCIRMSDFYMKLHAAGVGESCGSPMILLGLITINGFNLLSLKIFLLFIILLIISPTATNALVNTGIERKITPFGLVKIKLFSRKPNKDDSIK